MKDKVKNLNIEEYHSIKEYYSSSVMKKALKSLLHLDHYLNGLKEEKKKSDVLIFGNYYHTCILEPEKKDLEYCLFDEDLRPETTKGMTSKLNKAWKAEYEAQLKEENKIIISESMLEKAENMKSVLLSDDIMKAVFKNNDPEISYFTEDFHGIKVKVRPDIDISLFLGDLKTTADASIDSFERDIHKYNYDLSAALYVDVYEAIKGELKQFYIIAQEKEPPYDYMTYNMEKWLDLGRAKYMKAIEEIKKLESGVKIKGYSDLVPEGQFGYDTEPPFWLLKKWNLD